MSTISVSLPTDGTTADVADYNTPITTLVNDYNGNIDNSNISSSAAIAGSKIADGTILPPKISNPYTFRVYRATSDWSAGAGQIKVPFNGESFDTNSNFDSTTNFRYTAPVTGKYSFTATMKALAVTGNIYRAYLYKNGSVASEGNGIVVGTTFDQSFSVSDTLSLTAGDFVEVFLLNGASSATNGRFGETSTFFSGHLVSV